MRRALSLALVCLGVLLAVPATASVITIVNADTAGEGFNDPTPAAPVGGNNGTTLGQQRLNVFQAAASVWAALLPSSVTISVLAAFDPLACDATSAVLGSAGTRSLHRNFAGAEFANTNYPQALANKQAGADLSPAEDIRARFNRLVDNPTCLGSAGFYYGFDGNAGGNIDLFPVVLHELGHGLGFATYVDLTNGQQFNGFPDVFEKFMLDNQSGLAWTAMNNAQRLASVTNTSHVVWTGNATRVGAANLLHQRSLVDVSAPAAIAGIKDGGFASFGAAFTTGGVTGQVVQALDGSGTTTDACSPLTNGAAVSGRIALADRGTCGFVTKALNAQAAGAVGLVIVNDVSGSAPDLGGSSGSVTIPVTSVSLADGNAIKAQLGAGVVATLRIEFTKLAGADDQGRMRLYAPSPYEPGSSISHFDVAASPNLLMEPVLNADLGAGVDLTRGVFEDMGWLPRTTAVPRSSVVEGIALSVAPNPSAGAVTARFALPASGLAELAVFDLSGRRVRHIADTWLPAGEHALAWDGRDDLGRAVRPGVYLYRLRAGGASATRPVVRVE